MNAGKEKKRPLKQKLSPSKSSAKATPERKKSKKLDDDKRSSFDSNGNWNHYQLYFNVKETNEIQKLQEEEYIMREAELQFQKEQERAEKEKAEGENGDADESEGAAEEKEEDDVDYSEIVHPLHKEIEQLQI